MKLAILLAALLLSGCTVDVCTTTIVGPSGLGDGKPHCSTMRIP